MVRLNYTQVMKIHSAMKAGDCKSVDVDNTNLTNIIHVRFYAGRTKSDHLMGKDGKSMNIDKKTPRKDTK